MRPLSLPAVLLGAALPLSACQAEPKHPPARTLAPPVDVTTKDYGGPPLPRASVRWTDAFGAPLEVRVEVAATAQARERGLMWRTGLGEDEGMLFVFPEVVDHAFWMKNTLIPLDLLFLGPGGEVVGVVENATPGSLAPRGVGRPSAYVLEVPGGWAARHGVTEGARLQLVGVAAIPVGPEGR
ncbi:MAG: DUF192 domain-containing protein [Deltaproteobacteria bacterium]|nr:DUF192 domain-containing protein [Deltaproteobacteria bacterium]